MPVVSNIILLIKYLFKTNKMNTILQNDIDAYFNLHLVMAGARPAFLLEMQNDVRNMYDPSDYIRLIKQSFPNVHTLNIGDYRYLITKKRINMPKDDIELAELLDFDCKGIQQAETYYVLKYRVDGVEFYAAICPEQELFINKDARYNAFKRIADELGLHLTMEIKTNVKLTVTSFLEHTDFWLNNQEHFFSQLEGHGLSYLENYDLNYLIENNMPLLLFTLLRLDIDPWMVYYPLSPEEDRRSQFLQNTIIDQYSDPIDTFEALENEFVVPVLIVNDEYLDLKELLYNAYDEL